MKNLLLALGILALAGVVFLGDDSSSEVASERIRTISRGEEVEIAEHLDDDSWTVVEFGADW